MRVRRILISPALREASRAESVQPEPLRLCTWLYSPGVCVCVFEVCIFFIAAPHSEGVALQSTVVVVLATAAECWCRLTSPCHAEPMCCFEQVVEEQNTAAIRDLCRALQQHRLLESPHLHVRSLALEVTKLVGRCLGGAAGS